jgi:molybdopterin synthase sulfur carrier subunit
LKILFFARAKEELDCAELELPFTAAVVDLDGLQAELCSHGGEQWQRVLGQASMIRAVNQVVVKGNVALCDGDEVAFFPPVTGG